MTAPRPARTPDAKMPLGEHLGELRSRLVVSLVAVAVAGVAAWFLFPFVFHLLTRPYCRLPVAHRLGGAHCDLIVTGVLDAFNVRLRVTGYTALVLASPVWLFELWRFITPALYRNEKRMAVGFVATSLALFVLGSFAAFLLLSKGLRFLLGVAGQGLTPLIQVGGYLSFVLAMIVVFGVAFEFPVVVVALNLAGVVSYRRLASWRRMEIFLVFAFAAVTVPSGDPFSMIAMAVPMALLYEVALLFAWAHDRRVARRAEPVPVLSDDEPSPRPA